MSEFKEHAPPTAGKGPTPVIPGERRPRAPAPAPKVEKADPGAAPRDVTKPVADVDPTRYGDWEINGRCIDF